MFTKKKAVSAKDVRSMIQELSADEIQAVRGGYRLGSWECQSPPESPTFTVCVEEPDMCIPPE